MNPRRAHRFAQAIGKLAKTDRVDALMLARMGHVLELEPEEPRGGKQTDLNALSRARQALIKDRTALLARRATAAHVLVRRQLDRRLAAVEADIAELDAALAALIEQDEGLRDRAAIRGASRPPAAPPAPPAAGCRPAAPHRPRAGSG